MARPLAALLTFAAVLWTAAIFAAPALLAHPAVAAPAAAVYHGSSRICHQRPERSFHLAGVPMPVCARCASLYAAGAVGALLAWGVAARDRTAGARAILLVAAIPTAATWTLEAAGLMPFSNAARAAAGVPLGLAAGWVFVGMLRYDAARDAHEIHDGRHARRA